MAGGASSVQGKNLSSFLGRCGRTALSWCIVSLVAVMIKRRSGVRGCTAGWTGVSHTGQGASPVEVGGAGAGDLLLSVGAVEKHGLVWLGPGEVQVLTQALR